MGQNRLYIPPQDDTLEGAVRRLREAWRDLGHALLDAVEPALLPVIEWLSKRLRRRRK